MRMLAAMILGLLVAGCDGMTRIEGRVVDPDGKPVHQALVRLEEKGYGERNDEKKTAPEGQFNVFLMHAPRSTDLVLSVSKNGYKSHSESIVTPGSKHEKNREIVIAPEER